jgi:hypothetical protein
MSQESSWISFSHKCFIQWQGPEAQELTRQDIAENLHVSMGKQGLYGVQPEYYYDNFPLKDFWDRIYQEVLTAKCLHTINVKGKHHKAS